MAINLLQTAKNGSNSNVATLVLTFSNSIRQGSLVYIHVSTQGSGATISSISDGCGDSFSPIPTSPKNYTGTWYTGAWYALSSQGGSNIVTVNLSTTGNRVAAIAEEWSGIMALDNSVMMPTFDFTEPIVTPTVTTSNANDLLIASYGIQNGSGTWTPNGNWSNGNAQSDGSTVTTFIESQIVNNTGMYSGGGTYSISNAYFGYIAAFKALVVPFITPQTLTKRTRPILKERRITQWRGI